MSKKPSCADFIVEAIRQTRPALKNLKPGTCSGKALHLVYKLAKQFYSERVFRKSLHELSANGTILLAARVKERLLTNSGHYGCSRQQKIVRIPSKAHLEENYWFFDAKGRPVEEKERVHVRVMREIILYVVADGLPSSIAKTVSGKGKTAAEEIMASLAQK